MFNSSNLKRIICGLQLFAEVGSTVFNLRFCGRNNIRRNKSNERVIKLWSVFYKDEALQEKKLSEAIIIMNLAWQVLSVFLEDKKSARQIPKAHPWVALDCIACRAFRIVITKWANLLKNQLKKCAFLNKNNFTWITLYYEIFYQNSPVICKLLV